MKKTKWRAPTRYRDSSRSKRTDNWRCGSNPCPPSLIPTQVTGNENGTVFVEDTEKGISGSPGGPGRVLPSVRQELFTDLSLDPLDRVSIHSKVMYDFRCLCELCSEVPDLPLI